MIFVAGVVAAKAARAAYSGAKRLRTEAAASRTSALDDARQLAQDYPARGSFDAYERAVRLLTEEEARLAKPPAVARSEAESAWIHRADF